MQVTDLNSYQQDIINAFLQSLDVQLATEIFRLLDTGGISKDSDGYIPLSTLFKVALENEASKFGYPDKKEKEYKNLQKL